MRNLEGGDGTEGEHGGRANVANGSSTGGVDGRRAGGRSGDGAVAGGAGGGGRGDDGAGGGLDGGLLLLLLFLLLVLSGLGGRLLGLSGLGSGLGLGGLRGGSGEDLLAEGIDGGQDLICGQGVLVICRIDDLVSRLLRCWLRTDGDGTSAGVDDAHGGALDESLLALTDALQVGAAGGAGNGIQDALVGALRDGREVLGGGKGHEGGDGDGGVLHFDGVVD